MILKFGMEKLENLGYFSLADSLALSSVVLDLLTSKSPIFRFCTFWEHKHLDGFWRCGDQSLPRFICIDQVYVVILKSCTILELVAVQSGLKSIKMAQNFAVLTPCEIFFWGGADLSDV